MKQRSVYHSIIVFLFFITISMSNACSKSETEDFVNEVTGNRAIQQGEAMKKQIQAVSDKKNEEMRKLQERGLADEQE